MFELFGNVLCRSIKCRMRLNDSRVPMLFFRLRRHYCIDDKNTTTPTIGPAIEYLPKGDSRETIQIPKETTRKVKYAGASPNIAVNKNILLENGVGVDTIIDNSCVLWSDADDLKARIRLIQEMKPKHINDFVPLLVFDTIQLEELVDMAQKDIHVLPDGFMHRIYYFSDKLKEDPEVISTMCVNDPFLLRYDFEPVAEKLNIFLEYGIEPANILRDTGIFHCSVRAIQARLERLKAANITKVMPWMIRCVETAFEKAIRIRVDAKEALGKHESFESFLCECLDIEKQDAYELVRRHPRLSGRSVSMVKEIVEYLISETEYTRKDIASTPSVLYYGLETIKTRADELRKEGLPFPHLSQFAQGQNRFKKLITKLKMAQRTDDER